MERAGTGNAIPDAASTLGHLVGEEQATGSSVLLVLFLIYRVQARRLAFAEEIRKINTTLVEQITQRQQKETELRYSEQRAQRYLDVVEVIILALDRGGQCDDDQSERRADARLAGKRDCR